MIRPDEWARLPWPAKQRLQRAALEQYWHAEIEAEPIRRPTRSRKRAHSSEPVHRCRGCGSWLYVAHSCATCARIA